MFKYKILLFLLFTAFNFTPAYCQGKSQGHPIKIVSGEVTETDFVGNTISILTSRQQQMAFYIPSHVTIIQGAHDIGLLDINQNDPLTVQYYVSSPGKYTAVSIMDNKPIGPG